MTYVEFFDKNAAENICACLSNVPERVVLIGESLKVMDKHIVNYKTVFAKRGYEPEFIAVSASKNNVESAVRAITKIVEAYDDCVFDITGGDEMFMLALGIVYSNNIDKNIQIHRFNIRNNAIYDCDKDGFTIYQKMPVLSVAENVMIYGGEIVYGDISEEKTYLWDMSPEFEADIDAMWEICRPDVRLWNSQVGVLETVDALGKQSEDGLSTTVKISVLEEYLKRKKFKMKFIKRIICGLCRKGLITKFENDEQTVAVSYKNHQIKKCLTKSGQVLEMKIFNIARKMCDKKGAPIYNDAVNGAVIDWDGRLNDQDGVVDRYETTNEIDILLMHNMIPVFISCKNGIVNMEELYKLNTVAERFGGKYSKKVLIATAIDQIGDNGNFIRRRADDMNIHIIEGIQQMNDERIIKELKNLWNK